MSEYIATVDTVGELIAVLEQFPKDKPVRLQSLSHTWAPEIHEHERCVILEF